jgi:hypothetical protein
VLPVDEPLDTGDGVGKALDPLTYGKSLCLHS